MVSGCMMRKVKKVEKTGIEGERSAKENGDFMQLRSRRLYKSPDVSMEVVKKREGNLNSASKGKGKGKGKGKDGSGLKRKAEEKMVVVVEKEEENVEQVVEVNESVCFNEGGGGEFDGFVGPIDCGPTAKKAGGGGGGEDAIVGIDGEEGEQGMIGENLVPNDREIRESTPEHLIIRSNYIIADESSTRAPRGDVASRLPFANRRLQGGCVPSSKSIENLFAAAERQQEKLFMEKYNFDFKTESPLPGQYEWVKVEP